MNCFYRIYARVYQKTFWIAEHFMNFREPKLLTGPDAFAKLADVILSGIKGGALIVTDNTIYSLGLTADLQRTLKEKGVAFEIYHGVVPNPTVSNVNEALSMFNRGKYGCVIAIGGGSSIDTGKMVAALAANPHSNVANLKGLLKVRHKPYKIFAIPTTAGTGSEATVAAVIVNPLTQDKYACNDPKLIPDYAILEPSLLTGLPGKVTATVGIDALAHAVEAFIGKENTAKTKKYALSAIKKIYDNLYLSYLNPKNLKYREQMQLAAYEAGVAFTRAYVGYVHALAHPLGAFYNTPHGLAISIVMPYVLKAYGRSAYRKLAYLADLTGVGKPGSSRKDKAEGFIDSITALEDKMNIPHTIKGIADPKDFALMADHAFREANPLYPVPKIFDRRELTRLYAQMYI